MNVFSHARQREVSIWLAEKGRPLTGTDLIRFGAKLPAEPACERPLPEQLEAVANDLVGSKPVVEYGRWYAKTANS